MLDLRFDGTNPFDVEARFLADARDRRLGNLAELSQAFGGENLHVEPFLKAILFGPDAADLRWRVTRDHAWTMPFFGSKVQGSKTYGAVIDRLVELLHHGPSYRFLRIGMAEAGFLARGRRQFVHFLPIGPNRPLKHHLRDALPALNHHGLRAEIDRNDLNFA